MSRQTSERDVDQILPKMTVPFLSPFGSLELGM
jgi:hypothetical protein